MQERGYAHEAAYLERLRADGRSIHEIQTGDLRTPDQLRAAEAETLAAMRAGRDVIYQATFFDGHWRGHADFLLRVETPSDLGSWSYEIADTKLTRRVKAAAILQMCVYADRLTQLQGVAPREIVVVTGDGAEHRERLADYTAFFRAAKARFEARVFDEGPALETYPDPVEHCRVCAWYPTCADRRRADDHLSLVAGMTRSATQRLVAAELPTLASLGDAPSELTVKDVNPGTYTRLHDQARIQLEGRRTGSLRYELLPLSEEPNRGLAALPAIAARCLLRHRGRPVGRRGRHRVPLRLGRGGRRRGRLPRALGARPGRGEGHVRGVHRPRHRAARARPGDARLPLRAVRADGPQAPDEPLRHPRGRGRSDPARQRPGRPVRDRPPVAPGVGRVVLDQEDREVLHAPARGVGHLGRVQRGRVRALAEDRRSGHPGRDRLVQPRRLPLELAPARLAGAAPSRGRGGVRDRPRSPATRRRGGLRGRHRGAGRDAPAGRGPDRGRAGRPGRADARAGRPVAPGPAPRLAPAQRQAGLVGLLPAAQAEPPRSSSTSPSRSAT